MVSPVTYKTSNFESLTYSYDKRWYSQKPPYDLRLSCRNWHAWAKIGASYSWSFTESSDPNKIGCSNQARERLIAQFGDRSQLGASIAAEWRSSASMVGQRALQLFRFSRAVKRGHLFDAAAILNIPGKKAREIQRRAARKGYITKVSGSKVTVKDFGSLWLEYSYGWAPAVDDIYNATQVLERDYPVSVMKAGSHRLTSSRYAEKEWYGIYYNDAVWDSTVKIITGIKVNNPNLYMSNQLGLTNPATWVLEGIPFSFVIDWFSNLSQWVSQLTDFLGLDLVDPQTVHFVRYTEKRTYVDLSGWNGPSRTESHKGFTVLTRSPGVPSVKLTWGYEVPNWKRGLNAVSLLTQFLTDKK